MKQGALERLKALRSDLRQAQTERARLVPAPPEAAPDDARHLFRQAVKDARPLAPHDRVAPPTPPASLYPRHHRFDIEPQVTAAMSDYWPFAQADAGDPVSFLRSGTQKDSLKKLARGLYGIEADLDLHGHDTDAARIAVARFLQRGCETGLRCVRIIHGKGFGSRNGEPVLRTTLPRWLVQRHEVLAFSQAPARAGGSGALLVLLRQLREE